MNDLQHQLYAFEKLLKEMYGPFGKSQIWMDEITGDIKISTKEIHPDTIYDAFKYNPMLSVYCQKLFGKASNLTFWIMFVACLRYHYNYISYHKPQIHPIQMSRSLADIRTTLLPTMLSNIKNSVSIDVNALKCSKTVSNLIILSYYYSFLETQTIVLRRKNVF